MEQFLGRKYVMTHYENFEDYLIYIGLGFISRKIALNLRPVHSLTHNEDGTYLYNIHTTLYNWDIVFTPDIEFNEKRPDGQIVRATITLEDNIMIHIQNHPEGKHSKHVIEFYPDRNVVTTTARGFNKTVIRHYELVRED